MAASETPDGSDDGARGHGRRDGSRASVESNVDESVDPSLAVSQEQELWPQIGSSRPLCTRSWQSVRHLVERSNA